MLRIFVVGSVSSNGGSDVSGTGLLLALEFSCVGEAICSTSWFVASSLNRYQRYGRAGVIKRTVAMVTSKMPIAV